MRCTHASTGPLTSGAPRSISAAACWPSLRSLAGETLNNPNGILAEKSGTLLIGSGKIGALRRVDLTTKTMTTLADGMAATDGIVPVRKDGVLVSDWNGQVFYVPKSGPKVPLLDTRAQKINAADIEYVHNGRLLFVPTFFNNRVVAYRLE